MNIIKKNDCSHESLIHDITYEFMSIELFPTMRANQTISFVGFEWHVHELVTAATLPTSCVEIFTAFIWIIFGCNFVMMCRWIWFGFAIFLFVMVSVFHSHKLFFRYLKCVPLIYEINCIKFFSAINFKTDANRCTLLLLSYKM